MTRSISKERYERMVVAAQDLDPTADDFFSKLAKAGKCKPVTAQKAWRVGWPHVDLPPIMEISKARLLQWMLPARAIRQVMGTSELEDQTEAARKEMNNRATLDAISSRAEEAIMVGLARKSTIRTLRGILDQVDPVNEMVGKMVSKMGALVDKKMTWDEVERASRIWWRLIAIIRASSESAYGLIKMERLLLGVPTDISGVDVHIQHKVTVGVDAKSIADLAAQLEHSRMALLRLRDPHPDDAEVIETREKGDG